VKSYITYVDSGRQRHAKGLNAAIEVLVIQSVFIVPDTGRRISDPIPEKPDTVISRIRFELCNRCVWPGLNGRLHSRCRTNTRKCIAVAAPAHGELAIGGIVIHVALSGM